MDDVGYTFLKLFIQNKSVNLLYRKTILKIKNNDFYLSYHNLFYQLIEIYYNIYNQNYNFSIIRFILYKIQIHKTHNDNKHIEML